MSDGAPTPRITPFEMGLPGSEFVRERFAGIAEEADARDADTTDPGAFLLLGQVGRTVQDLREGEGGADQLRTFGAFLFHAFHFHRAGQPFFVMEKTLARYLVETNPVPEGWDHSLPETAGYLQLPQHLFWTRPDPEGPAEAVDGLFWTEGAASALSLLAVTGMRDDRAGFSVIPLPPVPLADVGEWLARSAREEGDDFETTLPGGELDRLYSVETAGELLKLLARTLGYLATVPHAVGESESGRDSGSNLPARIIRLVP